MDVEGLQYQLTPLGTARQASISGAWLLGYGARIQPTSTSHTGRHPPHKSDRSEQIIRRPVLAPGSKCSLAA